MFGVGEEEAFSEVTFSQGLGFGITGGLGTTYQFSENWSLLGELNFGTSSYQLKHGEVTRNEYRGVDQLPFMSTRDKEIEYVKVLDENLSGPVNQDEPQKAATFDLPGAYLGLRLGVRYSF
jgi:hypothetical protein